MKRSKIFTILIFLFTFLLFNFQTVFAITGDRSTPYNAWTNNKFTFQEYSWDSPKVVEFQLNDIYTGEEANYIIQNENMYNEVPASDEEWILMGFNLKYISGPEEPLYAYDVVYTDSSFYTNTGTKISTNNNASFSDILEGYGEFDVELYPGGSSPVYYAILVKKTVGYPLIRIPTGYNNTTYTTNYTWFSTDPNYVATTSNVKAVSSSYNSINTSWSGVTGASGYEVYRGASSTGTYTLVSTTTGTSYNNTGLTTNSTYYYKVRAYRMVGTVKVYSGYSTVISAKPIPATPTSVKAVSSSYNGINTSWSGVTGATGYEVYRGSSSTGTYALVSTTTGTSYNNTGLTTNSTYYYKVRAYRMVGTVKVYSGFSSVISAKPIPAIPINFKATRTSSTSIKLTWSTVTGANGYEIYRATTSTGTYSLLTKPLYLYYTNSGLITGKTYYYKMRSYRTVGTTRVFSNWTSIAYARP